MSMNQSQLNKNIKSLLTTPNHRNTPDYKTMGNNPTAKDLKKKFIMRLNKKGRLVMTEV